MSFRIWYSTESFANFIIDHTILKNHTVSKKKMYESDANNSTNFHTMPDHIKKILYLDAPDLIVEINQEPIFSIEISREAGTGHNAFQRFAHLAASVENNVPAFYIYPEAVIINRQNTPPKWDRINPLIFQALERMMSIYQIPALLYYYPSDYRKFPDARDSKYIKSKGLISDQNLEYGNSPCALDLNIKKMFQSINEMIEVYLKHGIKDGRSMLINKLTISEHRQWMNSEFFTKKRNNNEMSPITATDIIPTEYLLNYLARYENRNYKIGELLRSRKETIIYKVDAKFRGDPYPGALAAIDYLKCREGNTFEDRKYNLVLVWGNVQIDHQNHNFTVLSNKADINDLISDVQNSEDKNILHKSYSMLSYSEIPRYYMQMRYGSTYSKQKHIRVYSYFADAIIFPNGSLWRDA